MDIKLLTEKEVFQIAYITVHGWKFDEFEGKWQKPGFLRKTFKLRVCGCCKDDVEILWFKLEDAYEAQVEQDDAGPVNPGTKESADDSGKEN